MAIGDDGRGYLQGEREPSSPDRRVVSEAVQEALRIFFAAKRDEGRTELDEIRKTLSDSVREHEDRIKAMLVEMEKRINEKIDAQEEHLFEIFATVGLPLDKDHRAETQRKMFRIFEQQDRWTGMKAAIWASIGTGIGLLILSKVNLAGLFK